MEITKSFTLERQLQYMMMMRPLLNKKALFSDTTKEYVSPMEPKRGEMVTIRFRTEKNNVDCVNIIIEGGLRVPMKRTESIGDFDYYSARVQAKEELIKYHFEIKAGSVVCYYNQKGVTRDLQDYYDFKIIPGFSTPDWAKGAVMYQIYVDRFANGDPTNDVESKEYVYLDGFSEKVTDWDKYPAQMGVREFYGGDLQGVLDKMDYLSDLGVEVIYFNPLFVSPSNHKYDIQDYDYIDPHFGKIVHDEGELLNDDVRENKRATRYIDRVTNKENLEASNELFAKVVAEAHKRGMKVILDGVFNHCGSFNKWLDRERIYENTNGYEKGAFIDNDSPYRNYFKFYDENRWPYNDSYDGWWGHNTLPKLNYEESKKLYDYIMYIGKKWVSEPYNVDGWRLDVAADLGHSPEFNHKFWKDFRRSVKEANPNAIILAEHYGSPTEWLKGDEWDSVMNYDAFMEPITWFLTGMQKHSDDYREDLLGNADCFWGAMEHHGASFTAPSLYVAMNELSNHDHSRFLTRTNHKVGRIHTLGSNAANENVNKACMREAVAMQMTWIGAPTVYYGDEAGVCGFTDPDNRRTYPWGHEDVQLIDFHREMIRIHKENEELKTGSLKKLDVDYNYTSYGRFDRRGAIVVSINNNNYEMCKEFEVWQLGIPKYSSLKRLMLSHKDGFTTEEETIEVKCGKVKLTLPPNSAIVLKYEVSQEDYNNSVRVYNTQVEVDENAYPQEEHHKIGYDYYADEEDKKEQLSAWEIAQGAFGKPEDKKKGFSIFPF